MFTSALPSSPPSFPFPLLPPSLNGTHINTNAYKNRRRREGNHFTSLCRLSTSRDSKGTSTSFVLLSLTPSLCRGLFLFCVCFCLFRRERERRRRTSSRWGDPDTHREPEPPLSCEVMTPRHPAMCLLSTFFPCNTRLLLPLSEISPSLSLFVLFGRRKCQKAEGRKKKKMSIGRVLSRDSAWQSLHHVI